MSQFNLVQGFAQRGELVSFFAPFVCPSCGREIDRLIDLRHYFEMLETLALPQVECPGCKSSAEFDEVPELYFKYALSAPAPRPPAAANAAMGGEQGVVRRGRRFEMKKEVGDEITAFVLSGHVDQGAYFKRAADGVEGTPVLDVADMEDIADAGKAGLLRFFDALGERAVLVRVPPTLIEPLTALFAMRPALATKVASFLVALRCTGCRQVFGADVNGDKLSELVESTGSAELCPACMHPFEPPRLPAADLAAAAALPTCAPSVAVQRYLRTHSPAGRMSGVDRLAGPVAPRPLLLGKYQILRPLGQGGMGEVFLARQQGPENFEKLVVLKRIRRDRIGDPQSRDMFLREARIAACLSHPNIVRIFDLERMDDEYLITMEYVNGIDLARALQVSREARMFWPIDICCRVIVDLCSALHAAHSYQDEERSAPIIHRDVSPSNILLSTEGAVKLADFGIARAPGDVADVALTRGKVGYAAPEQSSGSELPISERTDIYAAGVVLYECLTLRQLTFGPTAPPTGAAASWRPHLPPQINVARGGAPPLLQDVFNRAIAEDPAQRYRTARDMGRDLERIGRMANQTTGDDLAAWIRRLIGLRRESGPSAPSILTMHTDDAVDEGTRQD
jgi:serine/threonine protein kinase